MGSSADKYYEGLEEESYNRQTANRAVRRQQMISEIQEMSPDDFDQFTKVFEMKKEVLDYFKVLDRLRFRLNK